MNSTQSHFSFFNTLVVQNAIADMEYIKAEDKWLGTDGRVKIPGDNSSGYVKIHAVRH